MGKIKIFRILLIGLLLPFVVLLVLQLRPLPQVHREAPASAEDRDLKTQARGIEWIEFDGDKQAYSALVDFIRQQRGGKVSLEGIERLRVFRENKPPLLLSARVADVEGEQGSRRFELREGVQLEDEEAGLKLTVERMQVDQAGGEARSIGLVQVEAPDYSGSATSVVYGLEDQPTRMETLKLRAADGGELESSRATLYDGTRDFELHGQVRLRRGAEYLYARSLRIWREHELQPKRIHARSEVRGAFLAAAGDLIQFAAQEVDLEWDAAGELESLTLSGDALLQRGSERLTAALVHCRRDRETPSDWDVTASRAVSLVARFGVEDANLRAENLTASLDAHGNILAGEASGVVDFTSPTTRAEADLVEFQPEAGGLSGRGDIRLTSLGMRRSRLARGASRVAAERIVTDVVGAEMSASGRVEATLLPAGSTSGRDGLFRAGEAVHFVAENLASANSGARLIFTGAVRAWQGDRTLAADRVTIDEASGELLAEGKVSTRIPQQQQRPAVSQADFIQVSAATLIYSRDLNEARYEGRARIRQAEGWLESDTLRILLTAESGDVRRVEGAGEVRFEYVAKSDSGTPQPVSGEGDRVEFEPATQEVLLYGDQKPAWVARAAAGGERATGRVLRYLLDAGTLEVKSGEMDRVKIRTAGGAD